MEIITINAITAEQAQNNVKLYQEEKEKVVNHVYAEMMSNILAHMMEHIKMRSSNGCSCSSNFRLVHDGFADKAERTVAASWVGMIEYNLPVVGRAGNYTKTFDDQDSKELLFDTLRKMGYSVVTIDFDKKVYKIQW